MLKRFISGFVALFILIPTLSFAADHKMVIQVNSKDNLTYKMALINAKNLKTQLGKDNVDVEIVAFGPGISMLKADNWTAKRVKNLQSEYGVKFSVCEGTLKGIAKKNGGVEPTLVDGVARVKTGAIRILALQEQGFHYMRP